MPVFYCITQFTFAPSGICGLFLLQALITSGWISIADDSRCTCQDNKMCCTSFGPLPVSTVGCEKSVNRGLIVVRHFDLSQSQAKGEQRMVFAFGRLCPFRSHMSVVPGEKSKFSK